MLGVGGVLAEAVADAAFRLAPLDRLDAHDLINDLGAQALLGEFRGEPAVDRHALADILCALGDLATDPDVASVDLNPLIVVDGQAVAVDALVETSRGKDPT
jgi:acetyl-CoA synthetase (ADP-forming)